MHEARIHAHICGDGHIYTEEGQRGTRYVIEYTNSCKELIEEYINDVKKEYGAAVEVLRHKNTYIARFRSKTAYLRLKALGAGRSREWRAPITIFLYKDQNKTIDLICAWIRAYIDDEGHIDLKTRRITITSVNENGLKDIRSLLEVLGVPCKMYKIMRGYAYRLAISGDNLVRLAQYMRPLHPEKHRRLQKLLSIYEPKSLKAEL